MAENAPTKTADYAVTFPHVIKTELKYPHQLTAADYVGVHIPDARPVLAWYFRVMTGGLTYENFVHSAGNRSQANVLTRENFENARSISAQGFSYADVEDLFGRELPELKAIPIDADLFCTREHDASAVAAVNSVYGHRGLQIANTTKLLYQKRPDYIPILDLFVRLATNIPWIPDTPSLRQRCSEALEKQRLDGMSESQALAVLSEQFSDSRNFSAIALALQQFRHVVKIGENRMSLQNLQSWAEADPEATVGLRLSSMRILDILAWSLVWHLKRDSKSIETDSKTGMLTFRLADDVEVTDSLALPTAAVDAASEAECYEMAENLFDSKAAEKRLDGGRGGFLMDEIRAMFKMLQADEREQQGLGPSGNPRPPILLFSVECVYIWRHRLVIAGSGNRIHFAYFRLRNRTPIDLRKPDGTCVSTEICGLDLDPFNPDVGIMLPAGFTEDDIPIGTEVWLPEVSLAPLQQG